MAGQITATPTVLRAINPEINVQGFGSYLNGILPGDIAAACGALRASLLQIRNIRKVPITKFAQAVINLELMRDLQINGTSVPTDSNLATLAHSTLALGSGPQGTYTMSDFFGCMSGLPYNETLRNLQNRLQDSILSNIYHELYLATTWLEASVNLTVNETAVPDGLGNFDYFYQITGIVLTNGGGGYGRGGAPVPQITISGGSGATAAITNWATTQSDANVATFGRLLGLALTNPGAVTLYGNGPSPVPPPSGIVATIEAPPITVPGIIGTTLPTGYVNSPAGTVGWPGMNTVVQNYITQANNRIVNFATSNPAATNELITGWNKLGTQLKQEQRARSIAFYPLPTPKNIRQPISLTPTTQITWTDNLSFYAKNTKPHMYAQTIEAISNIGTVGGQSIIGLMRQERNAARLLQAGIPLDNNIPVGDDTINKSADKALIGNTGESISSVPLGFYDASINRYVINNTPVDIGEADEPGSFAGSEYTDLIDPTLDALLISKQLTPATYNTTEARIQVEKCNCDCWDL